MEDNEYCIGYIRVDDSIADKLEFVQSSEKKIREKARNLNCELLGIYQDDCPHYEREKSGLLEMTARVNLTNKKLMKSQKKVSSVEMPEHPRISIMIIPDYDVFSLNYRIVLGYISHFLRRQVEVYAFERPEFIFSNQKYRTYLREDLDDRYQRYHSMKREMDRTVKHKKAINYERCNLY